jgi:hypothetical protein
MAALPWIALALQALGSVQQSEAAAASAKVNSMVADKNAQISEAQGAAAADAQQRDSQRRLGAAVAAYGASGAQLSNGSPVDVLADSARMATLDNLTLKYNYKLRSMGFQDEASFGRDSARAYKTAGYLGAAGTLAGGGSRAYYSQGGGTAIPKFGG